MTNEQINVLLTLPLNKYTYVMRYDKRITDCLINEQLADFEEVKISVGGVVQMGYRVVQTFDNVVDVQYYDKKLKLVDRIIRVYAQ